MRHFDVQLIGAMALHDGQIAEMRTGEGKTLTATLAVVLNSLAVRDPRDGRTQGRTRGDGQRLPRSTRRRMDEPDLRGARRVGGSAAEQAALRGQAAGVRVRRRLWHQLGVRLRLPARQHGQGPLEKVQRGHYFAVVDEVDNILDRRGAHAADHLRRARTGGGPVRRVRSTGPQMDGRQDARRDGPAHEEAVRGGLRLRDRREAQDGLDHRAGRRQGRAIPRHRPSLPGRERAPGQPPDPVAARRGAVQARRRLRGDRRRGARSSTSSPGASSRAGAGRRGCTRRSRPRRACASRRRTRRSRRSPTRTTSASTKSSPA